MGIPLLGLGQLEGYRPFGLDQFEGFRAISDSGPKKTWEFFIYDR